VLAGAQGRGVQIRAFGLEPSEGPLIE